MHYQGGVSEHRPACFFRSRCAAADRRTTQQLV